MLSYCLSRKKPIVLLNFKLPVKISHFSNVLSRLKVLNSTKLLNVFLFHSEQRYPVMLLGKDDKKIKTLSLRMQISTPIENQEIHFSLCSLKINFLCNHKYHKSPSNICVEYSRLKCYFTRNNKENSLVDES